MGKTSLQRYERLFAKWLRVSTKADELRRQWERAADDVRAENAARDRVEQGK